MNFNRSAKKKMSFERFLSYEYAGDYLNQTTPYAEQIEQAARAIREADYILLGAGAGMSTAAGAEYGGKFFEENFAEFQKIYGKGPYMRDMYSAGFYPFPDQESKWGLWSHLALLAGADLDVTQLHKTLLNALKGKKLFLLSTNADHQFEKAGLPVEQIFASVVPSITMNSLKPQSFVRNISRKSSGFSAADTPKMSATKFRY